jgi:hypothetical protein
LNDFRGGLPSPWYDLTPVLEEEDEVLNESLSGRRVAGEKDVEGAG